MIRYIPIILICHLSVPDKECNPNNNGITKAVGQHQSTPMACLIEGQARAATLAFSPKLNEPYYVRIKCVPKEFNN